MIELQEIERGGYVVFDHKTGKLTAHGKQVEQIVIFRSEKDKTIEILDVVHKFIDEPS